MDNVVAMKKTSKAALPTPANYETALADLRHELKEAKVKGGAIVRQYEEIKTRHDDLDKANASLRAERTRLTVANGSLGADKLSLADALADSANTVIERDKQLADTKTAFEAAGERFAKLEQYSNQMSAENKSLRKALKYSFDSAEAVAHDAISAHRQLKAQRFFALVWLAAAISMAIMLYMK